MTFEIEMWRTFLQTVVPLLSQYDANPSVLSTAKLRQIMGSPIQICRYILYFHLWPILFHCLPSPCSYLYSIVRHVCCSWTRLHSRLPGLICISFLRNETQTNLFLTHHIWISLLIIPLGSNSWFQVARQVEVCTCLAQVTPFYFSSMDSGAW